MNMHLASVALVAGLVAGCGSSSSGKGGGSNESCTPGESKACTCPGGSESTRVCDADGKGFADYACGAITPDAGSQDTASEDAGSLPGRAVAADHEVVVRLDEPLGEIPAIHGVNNGPLLKGAGQWPVTGYPNIPADYTARFIETGIPESRMHGEGPGDMEILWLPRNANGTLKFLGEDPLDNANYDFTITDQRIAANKGNAHPYFRCGHSAQADVHGYDVPPDDFDNWAQACAHIVARYVDAGEPLRRVEIWNEPWLDSGEFWGGTPLEYLDLYVASHREIHERLGDAVEVGFSLRVSLWFEPIAQEILARNGNSDPSDDVAIDYFAIHPYGWRPSGMRQKVHVDAHSVEKTIEYLGLPSDTPIVISEWNRGGGGGDSYAKDVPGQAFLVAGLTYLAEMHPTMGPHHVDMGHFYSAEGQLWDAESNAIKPPGVTWWLYGTRMRGETPTRLSASGMASSPATNTNESSHGTDFTALAGSSADGRLVQILLAYHDSTAELLPTDVGPNVTIDVTLEGGASNWAVTEEGFGAKAWETQKMGEIVDGALSIELPKNGVKLVRLERIDDGG